MNSQENECEGGAGNLGSPFRLGSGVMMKKLTPPKNFRQTKSMNRFYTVPVQVEINDSRPEGLWDVAWEIQRALELSLGDALIGVDFPSAQKWVTDPEPFRLEPRWKQDPK